MVRIHCWEQYWLDYRYCFNTNCKQEKALSYHFSFLHSFIFPLSCGKFFLLLKSIAQIQEFQQLHARKLRILEATISLSQKPTFPRESWTLLKMSVNGPRLLFSFLHNIPQQSEMFLQQFMANFYYSPIQNWKEPFISIRQNSWRNVAWSATWALLENWTICHFTVSEIFSWLAWRAENYK